MMIGPRGCGKTTSALRRAKTILLLDQTGVRNAMRGDPDAVLRDGDPPVLVDEWQLETSSLGAAKRLVDENDAPGQFIFAGSAADGVGGQGWPATGRFIRVPRNLGRTNMRALGLGRPPNSKPLNGSIANL
jgi:uncharacterized protein